MYLKDREFSLLLKENIMDHFIMDFSMDTDNFIGKTVASIEVTMKEEWEKVMDNFTTVKAKVYAEEYGEEEY